MILHDLIGWHATVSLWDVIVLVWWYCWTVARENIGGHWFSRL